MLRIRSLSVLICVWKWSFCTQCVQCNAFYRCSKIHVLVFPFNEKEQREEKETVFISRENVRTRFCRVMFFSLAETCLQVSIPPKRNSGCAETERNTNLRVDLFARICSRCSKLIMRLIFFCYFPFISSHSVVSSFWAAAWRETKK